MWVLKLHTYQLNLPVEEVNRVAPMVLNMPTKTRKAHAHIYPGHFHSGYVGIDVAKDRPTGSGQVI